MTGSNKHYDIANRNIYLIAQLTTIKVLLSEVQANVEVYSNALLLERTGILHPELVPPEYFLKTITSLQY